MYHWYLLVKETEDGRSATPQPSRFKAGGGPNWRESTPNHVRTRMFLLGAFECLPLALALAFGNALEPRVLYRETVACGVALTALLCVILRRYAPPTVIHARLNGEQHIAADRE